MSETPLPRPFYPVPAAIARRRDLNASAKLLWAYAWWRQNSGQDRWSVREAARDLGLGGKAAQRAIGELLGASLVELVEHGRLAERGKRGRAARYRCLVESQGVVETTTPSSPERSQKDHASVVEKTTPKGQNDHAGAVISTTLTDRVETTRGGESRIALSPPPGASMSGNGLGDLARKAWERSPHPPGQTESDCEETIRRHVDASKYTVKALGGYLEVTGTPGPFWELDTAVPAFVARRKGERETEELRRKEALARLLFAVPKGHVALHSGGRTGVVWVVTSGKVTVKTDPPEIEFVDLTTLEEFREWAFVPREDLVQTAKIR